MAAPNWADQKGKVKLFRKGTGRYTQEKLEEAIDVVRAKRMSLNGAAKYFGIPYGTLGDKIRGRRPIKAKPKTVFSPEEEQMLIDWLIKTSEKGIGHTRAELKEKVKEFLDSRGRKTIFKENRPGKIWMISFLKRHSDIASKIVRGVRSDVIPSTLGSLSVWFDEMQQCLDSLDPTLLESPDRIFTASEFVFSVNPNSGNVTGLLDPQTVSHGKKSTMRHVSVWACASASGQTFPPVSIFWNSEHGVSPNQNWNEVTENVLLNFLRDTFIPQISVQKPVVLFTNGLSDQHSEAVTSMCGENTVILQNLKTKESHLIQALYQTFYISFKSAWNKVAVEEAGDSVNLDQFPSVLNKIWDLSSQPDIFVRSFEVSGIYPYNPNIVLESDRLKPSDYFQNVLSNSLNIHVKQDPHITTWTSSTLQCNGVCSVASQAQNSMNNYYHPSAIDDETNSSSTAVSTVRNVPGNNNPPLDLSPKDIMLRIFKLMKLNFRIGEDRAMRFMKMYHDGHQVSDDPGYQFWKNLMDCVLSQMNFNFGIGEQTAVDFMRRYEGGGSEQTSLPPLYKDWKSLMDGIMSQCMPSSSPSTSSSHTVSEQESTNTDQYDNDTKSETISLPLSPSLAPGSQGLENGGKKKTCKMQDKCSSKRKYRKMNK